MRTLELKDFCGYMPHELFFVWSLNNDEKVEIRHFEKIMPPPSLVKPVLRPLSDLDKTITHNGKKIVPIVELAALAHNAEGWKYDEEYEYAVSESRDFWFCYDTLCCGIRLQTGYGDNVMIDNCIALYDYLNELKIDYRGLIDDGLAVSVYDLENNPYK